jgi:hypothetical protein
MRQKNMDKLKVKKRGVKIKDDKKLNQKSRKDNKMISQRSEKE